MRPAWDNSLLVFFLRKETSSLVFTILDRTGLASLKNGRGSADSSRVFLFLDGSSSVFSSSVLFLKFSTGMIVARDDESDTDVRVSELILGLTDMSLLVCLGFIKVNADLVASWSERGIVVSTLEDCG